MTKLRVGVLRGGPSSEYEVSLKTGGAILKHMPEKYHGHDIFISRDGTWHREGFERTPDKALTGIDVVFNALHGQYGEDGKVQRILENIGIPYTGSNSVASALAMNKALTKKAFETHKIKTPYYKVVRIEDNVHDTIKHAFHHFLLPVVVKPASAGSSVGVTIVKNFAHLEDALCQAFRHSNTAIIEEFIKGKEATCGVIDEFRGEKLYSLLPIEIIPDQRDFFDYEAKYNGRSQENVGGTFSDNEKQEIQRIAKHVHHTLGLRHYSRTDMIVTPRRGIYVLEVNTLPGLTEQSLLPKSLEAVGSTLPEFIDHILVQTLRRA